MYKYFTTLLIVLSMVITGCGESIYSGAENINSKDAKIDAFDFSFLKNDCYDIITYYDKQVADKVSLDEDDLYKYISATLACSGFDIVKGLDSILQTGGNDIYATAASIIGHKVIDINTANNLQKQYSKIIKICADYQAKFAKDNLTLNDTNLTLCGLAGTMGTVVNVSAMLLNSKGGAAELKLTETGFEEFGKDANPTSIGQGLYSYLRENNLFLADLDNGLILSEDAAKVLGDLLGQDSFSSVLGELAASLRDPTTHTITEDSLISYISKTLNITIPENIFPEIPQP